MLLLLLRSGLPWQRMSLTRARSMTTNSQKYETYRKQYPWLIVVYWFFWGESAVTFGLIACVTKHKLLKDQAFPTRLILQKNINCRFNYSTQLLQKWYWSKKWLMHNSALHQPQVMNCEVVQRSQLDAELWSKQNSTGVSKVTGLSWQYPHAYHE